VVGIGAVPNDGCLTGSGLGLASGVLCDEYCRAVGVEDVFVAGDVARWFHPGRQGHLRMEHWTHAMDQAALVAHNIVHPEEMRPCTPVEYVWSDQYDWKIQITGRTGPELDPVTVHGNDPERSFAVLYGAPDGTMAGALVTNWPRALITCRRVVGTVSVEEARRTVEALVRPLAGSVE
jgi:phthalate 3,4-dioxygenase ferredoxin reductase subunit